MRRRFETAPKPFEIVPFEADAETGKLVGHERYLDKFTGKMVLQIENLSPLHIGSGLWEIINNQVVRDVTVTGNKEFIPGSSLKGAFRTITETISKSCVCKTRQRNLARKLKECEAKKETDKLCPTCSIFGAMGYKGRVSFGDAPLVTGNIGIARTPALYGPRPTAKLYKDRAEKYKGRKFYYHGTLSQGKEPVLVVDTGAKFECDMCFENLSTDEFGLVLTSLGIIGGLKPKIGGGKPVCMGTIQVVAKSLELRKDVRKSFASYSSGKEAYENAEQVAQFIKKEIEKSNNPLILKESLARLKSVWKYPSARQCPSIAY